MSKLAKQIVRIIRMNGFSVRTLFAHTTLHVLLKNEGVGCTKNQVRLALKRYFVPMYEELTGRHIYDSEFFLKAVRAGYDTPFWCQCGNPSEHDTRWCERSINYEKENGRNYYHCEVCRMYGDDRYADPNGIVWVNGITACELNQQIVERTEREDAQMRRLMTYAFADAPRSSSVPALAIRSL